MHTQDIPLHVMIHEAKKAIRQDGYTIEMYGMFVGWLYQFCDNADDLTEEHWNELFKPETIH